MRKEGVCLVFGSIFQETLVSDRDKFIYAGREIRVFSVFYYFSFLF